MADPTGYEPSYSFSDFQSNSPSEPLPAPKVDIELLNISQAVISVINAVKDLRREDGALNNNIVTYESLALDLQLTFDPTNGQLVAAAVLGAQASAASALASKNAAAGSAADALAQAIAAAASAASVNLALYMPKAGNLAGIGSADTARTNINAASRDGSDMVGRLAPITSGANVADFNSATQSGWYSGSGAANSPSGSGTWLVQTIAYSSGWISQFAYPFTAATSSVAQVLPYRRHSYDNSGVPVWQPWESMGPVPVGSIVYAPGTAAFPGFLKLNGALVSRAVYDRLWAYAATSGALVDEASWGPLYPGAFSTGDVATTFRLPDGRGEFIRNFDDGRGVDASRVIGSIQLDKFKDHTHPTLQSANGTGGTGYGNGGSFWTFNIASTSGTANAPDGGGTETRPRNIAWTPCIKY